MNMQKRFTIRAFSPLKPSTTAFGPTVITAAFALLCAWSWRRWPDIIIDFGRELYSPWELASGKVLYRDLAHVFGPLSQYYHSLLFRLFGVSYSTIIASNLVLLVLLTLMLYRLVLAATDERTATLGCLVFLALFGFSQYVGIGNYNYMSPYSHETTHGVILSVAMIYGLSQFVARPTAVRLAGSGMALGLVFLTRAEPFMSASVTAFACLLILALEPGAKVGQLAKWAGGFAAAALAPPLVFLLYFATKMPWLDAFKAIGGSWTTLLTTHITNNVFHKRQMGTDHVLGNAWLMLEGALVVTAVLGFLALACAAHSRCREKRLLRMATVLAMAIVVVLVVKFPLAWLHGGRPLPLLTGAIFLILSVSLLRQRRGDRLERLRLVPMVLWSVFAMCQMLKFILNVTLYHYGYFLAMPAVVLLVVFVLWHVPRWLDARGANGRLFSGFALALIAVGTSVFFGLSRSYYAKKQFAVGRGGDRIMAFSPSFSDRGRVVAEFLAWAEAHMKPDATFIAAPEGIMLNYLARRRNPTRFTKFVSPPVLAQREPRILAEFEAHPPDYFLLVERDTSEFDVGYFGSSPDFGKRILDWILARYEPVHLIGHEPLRYGRFGIKVLERKAAVAAP